MAVPQGRGRNAAAGGLCDQLNRLLNRTVTRARVVATRSGQQVNLELREGGQPGAVVRTRHGRLILCLQQRITASDSARSRVVVDTGRYRYSLAVDRDFDALLRWDGHHGPRPTEHPYCTHHLQGTLAVELPRAAARLNDFHVPTGHVLIQDILRFLVADLGVRPLHQDWDRVLNESASAS